MQVKALTIKESYVDLETPTGLMRTYILQPKAPGKYPGIVFFSEIFQVRPQMTRPTARHLGGWLVPHT